MFLELGHPCKVGRRRLRWGSLLLLEGLGQHGGVAPVGTSGGEGVVVGHRCCVLCVLLSAGLAAPVALLIVPGCLGARRRTVSMRGPAAGCVALRVAPADKALCGRRYKARWQTSGVRGPATASGTCTGTTEPCD